MERELLSYLRAALPTADQIELSDEYLLRIVRHAVMVRENAPWGRNIPEWMFRAFVLFPRVNDERPSFYQEYIYGELAQRIQGMSMTEAALEVNKWTCERATYQLTDDRTADALTVLRRTFGRCGEESTLLVSALRSVGIPARQVYAPRWSHCDDNHAWVEAWVDGEWHYLGACEPEPVMDSGWFTAAASKAMLMHTRAYGIEPEGERVENKIGNAYVINRTPAYTDGRVLTVKVTENGQPKPGAVVRFEIANMAELFPINEQITDENGTAELAVGFGTINLHVHDGERYCFTSVDTVSRSGAEIDFSAAVDFERTVCSFHQIPPKGTRIQPSIFPQDVVRAHEAALARCEQLRTERMASFPKGDRHVERAFGNHAEIEAFLADGRFSEADKRAILDTLTYKDFGDVTAETLADALQGALAYRGVYPEDVWVEGVMRPRVWNEPMSPSRALLKEAFPAKDAHSLWTRMKNEIEICEMTPVTLTPDLRAMAKVRKAGEAALDVLFVAAARANGIAARLNPGTGEKEIWDGEWKSLIPAKQADAMLTLVNASGRELVYGVHFTIGVKEGGAFRTLSMNGAVLKERMELPLYAGKYRVIACTRQIDGRYDGTVYPVEIASGGAAQVEIELPKDRTSELVQCVKLPELAAGGKLLPEAGRPAIIAMIAPGQEPTEHFLNELLDAKGAIAESGAAIQLLIEDGAQSDNLKLQTVLREIDAAQLLAGPDMQMLIRWRELMDAGELRLPLVIAADREGSGRFAIANYNVGSVLTMLKAIGAGKDA